MVVSDRWAGSDRNFYSRNCKCIGIFWKKGKYQCDSGGKYLVDAKGQTRADRTATVTKITIHYNQRIQKSITWAQQNGITDNWKGDAWGDVSNFSYNNQIVGRESGVKKKTQQRETVLQADGGGVMVWVIFSWHIVGPLVDVPIFWLQGITTSPSSDHLKRLSWTFYCGLMSSTVTWS